MSRNSQKKYCQVAMWETTLVTRDATKGAARLGDVLVRGLLGPADEKPIEIDGELLTRHECDRCSMAILTNADNSKARIDVSKGECISAYGQEVMKKYPKWPIESIE